MNPCVTLCFTALCAALGWSPVPDADVSAYVIRVEGYEVGRLPASECSADWCVWNLPQAPTSPTTFNVRAVDLGGLESRNAAYVTYDPELATPPDGVMEAECVDADCTMPVCTP
jgi:hypothetical protein